MVEQRRKVLLVATLVFSGLRVSEFVTLRWRDVDLAGGWLEVGQSKTAWPRPATPPARPAAIGEPPPVVMQEMGHTDPALALAIYAHAMRRDEGENEHLKALVEGADLPGLGTSAHSGTAENQEAAQDVEAESRS